MYLNCKTNFSIRYGTYTTKELVESASEIFVNSLALTNINNSCECWNFVDYCRKQNIKPILGTEIRNGDQFCYILIAATNNGFRWINKFLSHHLLSKFKFPSKVIEQPFFEKPEDIFVVYSLQGKELDHWRTAGNECCGV